MKASKYSEYQQVVKQINDANYTYFFVDESYSNISSLYETAVYLNKKNNLLLGEDEPVKIMSLLSEEKNELVEFTIYSNEKRSIKFFFILECCMQLYLSREKTRIALKELNNL